MRPVEELGEGLEQQGGLSEEAPLSSAPNEVGEGSRSCLYWGIPRERPQLGALKERL